MKLGRLLVVVVLVVTFVVGGLLGGLVVIWQTRDQSRTNQRHFDCAVSVFAQTEPPQCARIIAEFRRTGIFPPAGAPRGS